MNIRTNNPTGRQGRHARVGRTLLGAVVLAVGLVGVQSPASADTPPSRTPGLHAAPPTPRACAPVAWSSVRVVRSHGRVWMFISQVHVRSCTSRVPVAVRHG